MALETANVYSYHGYEAVYKLLPETALQLLNMPETALQLLNMTENSKPNRSPTAKPDRNSSPTAKHDRNRSPTAKPGRKFRNPSLTAKPDKKFKTKYSRSFCVVKCIVPRGVNNSAEGRNGIWDFFGVFRLIWDF